MTSLNIVGMIFTLLPGVLISALFSRKSDLGGSDAKLRELERALENAKGELYVHHDALSSLKTEHGKCVEQIKARDARIAELERRADSLANEKFAVESGLNASNSRAEAFKTEADLLRLKLAEAESEAGLLRDNLAEAEAEMAKPAKPDPAMVAEIESLRKTVLSQNNDVSKLLIRVKELAPLKLQITDRDLRLKKLEEKQQAETAKNDKKLKTKDEEIARLAAELRAASKVKDLKEDEWAILNDRVAELESAIAEQSGLVSQLRESKAELEFALGEKDSLLADLQLQLDAVSAEAAQDSSLRDKDAAISLLQLRVKELEPLVAQLAERDLKLRRTEDALLELVNRTEAEIAQLQQRVGELEAVAGSTEPMISAAFGESKLREFEHRQQALETALADKDAEIVRLKSLAASSPDDAHARVEAAEAKTQELKLEFNAELSSREEENLRLQARIAELEPLHAQLFARDARLIELEARLQSAINEKESEAKHLNARIAELEPSGALAEAAEARLRELEKQHQTTVNNLEVELSGLRVKLAGMEGLNTVLTECMDKLREAEARLGVMESVGEG